MFAERSTCSRTSSAQVASMFCERSWREATTHVTFRSGQATGLATCGLTRPGLIITGTDATDDSPAGIVFSSVEES